MRIPAPVSAAGSRPGQGVGLANVRERIAALFGAKGRFSLVEAPPRGARATIEIPLAEDDIVTTALIAEDEPLLRAQLKARLAEAWPELDIVAEAGNGDEALELAEALRPDIAFLDIRMPVRTGLEVAREIGGGCHVVFVTAYDEYAVAAFDEGAVDYVLKPPDPRADRKGRRAPQGAACRGAARPHGAAREARAARRRQRTAQVDSRFARRLDADDRRRRRASISRPATSTRE